MPGNLSPIALFTYNRPIHLKHTIRALQNNFLAQKSTLYIFSDNAKNTRDEKNVVKVRQYIRSIEGFHHVYIIERKSNYGIVNNMILGISDILNKYNSIIVLDDDLITSQNFLRYINEALDYYKYKPKVISISGYSYPIKKMPETYFLRGADCWGWATWRRGWKYYNNDPDKLYKKIILRHQQRRFEYNYSYPYMKMLGNQVMGKNDSWAVRWYASAFLANKFTLYPGHSFVKHIGEKGTHLHKNNSNTKTKLNKKNITDFFSIPEENIEVYRKVVKYLYQNSGIVNRLKSIFM